MSGYFARREYGDGRCDTTECAEKVEAMLSTAILQQEDLWNLLMLNAPENLSYNPETGDMSTVAEISPEVLNAMKTKLENAMDWCQLAQSRIKGIIQNDSTRLSPSPTFNRSELMYGGR